MSVFWRSSSCSAGSGWKQLQEFGSNSSLVRHYEQHLSHHTVIRSSANAEYWLVQHLIMNLSSEVNQHGDDHNVWYYDLCLSSWRRQQLVSTWIFVVDMFNVESMASQTHCHSELTDAVTSCWIFVSAWCVQGNPPSDRFNTRWLQQQVLRFFPNIIACSQNQFSRQQAHVDSSFVHGDIISALKNVTIPDVLTALNTLIVHI